MIDGLRQIEETLQKRRVEDAKGLIYQHAASTGIGTNVSKYGLLTGAVALGMLVRTDDKLHESGRFEGQALIVHSRDRLLWSVPELLGACVNRLMDDDAEVRRAGAWSVHPLTRLNQMSVTLDERRPLNMALHKKVTDGFDVRLSRIIIQRGLLPKKRLVTQCLPVVVPQSGASLFMPFVLHEWYWPASWQERGGP